MANWEYKVISSGKHGMATMAALEQHLNDLGQQQWEIINWHTAPDNPLLFTGLARRPILRDWKPDEMPAAVAAAREKAEDEKERAAWRDTLKEELEFITERDNEIEDDPEADTEDLLDMLAPLMRRSQRGPGSVGAISFLSRKLNQSEEDLLGALAEAGLALAEDPNAVPPSLEHDGDFFWLNRNGRDEIWLNSGPRAPTLKPKAEPRAERPAREDRDDRPDHAADSAEGDSETPAAGAEGGAPAADAGSAPSENAAPREPRRERERDRDRGRGRDRDRQPDQNQPSGEAKPLPEGEALLDRIRPMMRRNRRGRGLSGSISYLSRALRHSDADLSAALAKLGLSLSEDPQAKPVFVEIGRLLYWMNRGQGGQIWINTRELRAGETAENAGAEETAAAGPEHGGAPAASSAATDVSGAPDAAAATTEAPAETAPAAAAEGEIPVAATASGEAADLFVRIRPHFTKNKRGASYSAAPGPLAEALGLSQADLVESLVKAGLEVPENEDSKPVYAEHEGDLFWFNRNAKDELWLNAKSKPARRGRGGSRSGGAKAEEVAEGAE